MAHHLFRSVRGLLAPAVTVLAAAGLAAACSGGSGGSSGSSVPPAQQSGTSAQPNPAGSAPVAMVAAANERRFAFWLAGGAATPTTVASAVSGPAMRAPGSPAPAVQLQCKILQTSTGEEFSVTTVGAARYRGPVDVSFLGTPGSGQSFPGTVVQGATPVGSWHPLPADDTGANAEPASCTASPG